MTVLWQVRLMLTTFVPELGHVRRLELMAGA